MQEIHIMSGLPASGKTTCAVEMTEKNPNLIHLSRDKVRADLRAELKSTEYFPCSQNEEWNHWMKIVNEKIVEGKSVIIDQTTLGAGALTKLFKSLVLPTDAFLHIHIFVVPLAQCQFRNGFREGFEYVPPDIIQKMYNQAFKSLSASEVRRLLIQSGRELMSVSVHTHQ